MVKEAASTQMMQTPKHTNTQKQMQQKNNANKQMQIPKTLETNEKTAEVRFYFLQLFFWVSCYVFTVSYDLVVESPSWSGAFHFLT